jgi:toxin CptA
MPIAVSVPIVPSRLLRWIVCGFAAMCGLMGAMCTAGMLGALRWPTATGALGLAAGLAVLVAGNRRLTHRRIDVLGVGRLALTVQQEVGPARRFPVRLLPGSTLWPGLLVLRLEGAPVLILLRDSVPPGEFRRLGVALRAVAGRAGGAVETR